MGLSFLHLPSFSPLRAAGPIIRKLGLHNLKSPPLARTTHFFREGGTRFGVLPVTL